VPSDEEHLDTGIGQGLTPSIIDRLLSGDARTAAALAAGGENQWVELKEGLPSASMIIKVLAAFANSGGGVLIVGVSDTGQAMGWQRADSDAAARQMREIADTACRT
jgi:predicted HTH transcriptional regulator